MNALRRRLNKWDWIRIAMYMALVIILVLFWYPLLQLLDIL